MSGREAVSRGTSWAKGKSKTGRVLTGVGGGRGHRRPQEAGLLWEGGQDRGSQEPEEGVQTRHQTGEPVKHVCQMNPGSVPAPCPSPGSAWLSPLPTTLGWCSDSAQEIDPLLGSAGVRRDDPGSWEKCQERGTELTSDPRLLPTPSQHLEGFQGKVRKGRGSDPGQHPGLGNTPSQRGVCEIRVRQQIKPDACGRQVCTPPPSLGAGGGRNSSG